MSQRLSSREVGTDGAEALSPTPTPFLGLQTSNLGLSTAQELPFWGEVYIRDGLYEPQEPLLVFS